MTVANAGTPVPIKSSSFVVKGFVAQADPGNTGTYMMLKDSAGNIMEKFSKGQTATLPMTLGGNFDLNSIQLDTDTNGDGAFITYV